MDPESPDERAAVERFLRRHALPEREAVAADAAPYRDMSVEERFRHLEAACRAAAAVLAALSAEDRRRAQEPQPPHPSWPALRRRLAAERAAARGAGGP